ncbi:MAG: hypothetical protein H6815_00325 [Phycisphaeraceae bacterium]|nr:hypothetical protein [Phycisphaerales bacterium]MCB9858869.1 hypothetical protein [Phycisphaeraceae bacterium]
MAPPKRLKTFELELLNHIASVRGNYPDKAVPTSEIEHHFLKKSKRPVADALGTLWEADLIRADIHGSGRWKGREHIWVTAAGREYVENNEVFEERPEKIDDRDEREHSDAQETTLYNTVSLVLNHTNLSSLHSLQLRGMAVTLGIESAKKPEILTALANMRPDLEKKYPHLVNTSRPAQGDQGDEDPDESEIDEDEVFVPGDGETEDD